jgi:hypothetical protein
MASNVVDYWINTVLRQTKDISILLLR